MRSPSDKPLTDAEFEELDDYLLSDDSPEECMDISMLDGLFAALAIRPDLIRPSVWLPEVWGGESEFRDLEQAQHLLGLLMRYYNEVVSSLREAPEDFEPLFYTRKVKGKTIQIIDEWCVGFVRGLTLENAVWTTWLLDPDLKSLLGPFLLFGTPAGWEQLKHSGREEEIHGETVRGLRPALKELWRMWRVPASSTLGLPAVVRPERNGPCPCGSGKKYKRCCGAT